MWSVVCPGEFRTSVFLQLDALGSPPGDSALGLRRGGPAQGHRCSGPRV